MDRIYYERQARQASGAQNGPGLAHPNSQFQPQHLNHPRGHVYDRGDSVYDGSVSNHPNEASDGGYSSEASDGNQSPDNPNDDHRAAAQFGQPQINEAGEEEYDSDNACTNVSPDNPNDDGTFWYPDPPAEQPSYGNNQPQSPYDPNQYGGQQQNFQRYGGYLAASVPFQEIQEYASNEGRLGGGYTPSYQGEGYAPSYQGVGYDSSNVYTGGPAYGGSPSTFRSSVPTNVLQYQYYQGGQSYAPNQGYSSNEE